MLEISKDFLMLMYICFNVTKCLCSVRFGFTHMYAS